MKPFSTLSPRLPTVSRYLKLWIIQVYYTISRCREDESASGSFSRMLSKAETSHKLFIERKDTYLQPTSTIFTFSTHASKLSRSIIIFPCPHENAKRIMDATTSVMQRVHAIVEATRIIIVSSFYLDPLTIGSSGRTQHGHYHVQREYVR